MSRVDFDLLDNFSVSIIFSLRAGSSLSHARERRRELESGEEALRNIRSQFYVGKKWRLSARES